MWTEAISDELNFEDVVDKHGGVRESHTSWNIDHGWGGIIGGQYGQDDGKRSQTGKKDGESAAERFVWQFDLIGDDKEAGDGKDGDKGNHPGCEVVGRCDGIGCGVIDADNGHDEDENDDGKSHPEAQVIEFGGSEREEDTSDEEGEDPYSADGADHFADCWTDSCEEFGCDERECEVTGVG